MKRRILDPERLKELGVDVDDAEDVEMAEDIVAFFERLGNALFYTAKAAVASSQGGHDLAMNQWRELGLQAIGLVVKGES